MIRDPRFIGALLLIAPLLLAAAPSACYAEDPKPADSSEQAHSGDGHEGDHDHEEHAEGSHSGAPDPLVTDPDLALWTFGVFVLMLIILSQTAWKPIMEGLKAREDGISGAIAQAEQTKEEAKKLLAEHEAKLSGAAEQVKELLEEARRDADATMAQAKIDAKAEFEAERQRAARDIQQARDAAIRDLAESTAGLAIDLAGRVVGQEISTQRHGEIVGEALNRFSAGGPSQN